MKSLDEDYLWELLKKDNLFINSEITGEKYIFTYTGTSEIKCLKHSDDTIFRAHEVLELACRFKNITDIYGNNFWTKPKD